MKVIRFTAAEGGAPIDMADVSDTEYGMKISECVTGLFALGDDADDIAEAIIDCTGAWRADVMMDMGIVTIAVSP